MHELLTKTNYDQYYISIQGSVKIENNCTSTIKIKESENGNIFVEVNHSHYGHKQELQHIWLTNRRVLNIPIFSVGKSSNKFGNNVSCDSTHGTNACLLYTSPSPRDS